MLCIEHERLNLWLIFSVQTFHHHEVLSKHKHSWKKSAHSVKEPERSNLQTRKTPASQVPTPSLEPRISNANLSTFFHPGKKRKNIKVMEFFSVILKNNTFSQHFPFLTLSWCKKSCKNICPVLWWQMAANLGQHSQAFSFQKNDLAFYFSVSDFVHEAEINHQLIWKLSSTSLEFGNQNPQSVVGNFCFNSVAFATWIPLFSLKLIYISNAWIMF